VKISDGKRQLWLLCEQIFKEIKEQVISGDYISPTDEMKYALEYGHWYLLTCNIQDDFHWLVDMIIVHIILTADHDRCSADRLSIHWRNALRRDETISLQLRQRISWHLIEICSMNMELMKPCFTYLQIVLDHSPKGCFTDDERKLAKEIVEKRSVYTKRCSVERKSLMLLLAKLFKSPITAIGVSSNKKLAAVALEDGTVCVLSLPDLVVLFQFSTGCAHIPCCIFSPDDSLVLYGKLDTALSIAAKKAVPFFSCIAETFKTCSFSPNGRKLVTSNSSNTVKLWDVGRQSLVSVLSADNPLHRCSFNKTGLFITGHTEDSYCVWSAITFQRVDLRSSSSNKCNENGFQKSKRCNRCLNQVHKELVECISSGMYNGVECIFIVDEQSLRVIERVHFTTFAVWGLFLEDRRSLRFFDIIAIEDHHWLYVDQAKLIVLISEPHRKKQIVLWCSFSSDGTRLATCTSEGFIQLWNVDTCQVSQSFRDNIGTSSAACWWSNEQLLVCHFEDGIPSLSRYPFDENFTVPQVISVPLFPVVKTFLPFWGILDFSEGCITFDCGPERPVKVLDVIRTEGPEIVVLPGLMPMMSITVSTGASYILGTAACSILLWRRNATDSRYGVLTGFQSSSPCHLSGSCFSRDSRYAVSFAPARQRFVFIDVVNRTWHEGHIEDRLIPPRHCTPAKLFCTNGLIILVTSNLIEFFQFADQKCRERFFQRYFPPNSVCHAKLSPKGNVLAVPVNGDMEFFTIHRRN
jgi:WD40 repeat protein